MTDRASILGPQIVGLDWATGDDRTAVLLAEACESGWRVVHHEWMDRATLCPPFPELMPPAVLDAITRVEHPRKPPLGRVPLWLRMESMADWLWYLPPFRAAWRVAHWYWRQNAMAR